MQELLNIVILVGGARRRPPRPSGSRLGLQDAHISGPHPHDSEEFPKLDIEIPETPETCQTPQTPKTVSLPNFGGIGQGVSGIYQPNFN